MRIKDPIKFWRAVSFALPIFILFGGAISAFILAFFSKDPVFMVWVGVLFILLGLYFGLRTWSYIIDTKPTKSRRF